MREILFKAKRIDNGEWVEGFVYVCGRTGEVEISWYNEEINMERYTAIVDPETVCEYTGLVDSKGNKIFEHDIIDIIGSKKQGIPAPVEWFSVECQFAISRHPYNHIWLCEFDPKKHFKIVGNKFD